MTEQLPQSIEAFLKQRLNQFFKEKIEIVDFTTVSGGCINFCGKLALSVGNYFIKWNDANKFSGMLQAEKRGIELLASTKTVNVPGVLFFEEYGAYQILVMEFIQQSQRNEKYWRRLGEHLALLHRNTSSHFGLDHDNYIGALKQTNTFTKSWIDFFINSRLAPQIKLLQDTCKVDYVFVNRIESIYRKLGELLPMEPPALLHGDLWSGNVLAGESGPYVIDPAVYYGHREAEMAFTSLFGGFDNAFYEAYNKEFPMQPKFHQRIEVYNLYPLLVHANLFGQSYISGVASILKKYT